MCVRFCSVFVFVWDDIFIVLFFSFLLLFFFFFFFFQAEDGIRDFHVTGVQTCALPISNYFLCMNLEIDYFCPMARTLPHTHEGGFSVIELLLVGTLMALIMIPLAGRSEERRVGKECRSRGLRDQ